MLENWLFVRAFFLTTWVLHLSKGNRGCGVITYQEPVITYRYVRLIFQPDSSSSKPDDTVTWKLFKNSAFTTVENGTNSIMSSEGRKFILDFLFHNQLYLDFYATVGDCRSSTTRIRSHRNGGCGVITYQEPVITYRYVRLIFQPDSSSTTPDDTVTWKLFEKGKNYTTVENDTKSFMSSEEGKFILDLQLHDQPDIDFYAKVGNCRSNLTRIKINRLDLFECGLLVVQPTNYRPGGKVTIKYYPHNTIVDNLDNYNVTWFVKPDHRSDFRQVNEVQGQITLTNDSFYNHPVYIMVINSVMKERNGEYHVRCNKQNRTKGVTITTPEKPGEPRFLNITNNGICKGCIVGKINMPLTIICQAVGGTNKTITISIGGEMKTEIVQGNSYSFTIDRLTERYHDVSAKCEVTNLALDTPLRVIEKLYVARPPSYPKIHMGEELRERFDFNVTCSITPGRPDVGLRFLLNEPKIKLDVESFKTENKRSIRLNTLQRSFNGQSIRCCYETSTVYPESCVKEVIDFKYIPEQVRVEQRTMFTSIQSNYMVKFECIASNYSANCSTACFMDGNRTTEETVSKSEDTIYSPNKTLNHIIRIELNKSHNGRLLTCSSTCNGFEGFQVQGNIILRVPYTPIITFYPTNLTLNLNEGEMLDMKCTVDSYPEPEITWKNETGETMESEDCGRVSKCLKFARVSLDMAGLYTCVAKHRQFEYQTNKSFELSVKEKSSEEQSSNQDKDHDDSSTTLIVIAGAITAFVLIIALGLVIIICKKKSAKQATRAEERQEDDDMPSHPAGSDHEEGVVYASPLPRSQRQPETVNAEHKATTSNTEPKELIYADLDLPEASGSKGESGTTIIIRSEGETEYVDINFSKRAAPLEDPADTQDNTYANQ